MYEDHSDDNYLVQLSRLALLPNLYSLTLHGYHNHNYNHNLQPIPRIGLCAYRLVADKKVKYAPPFLTHMTEPKGNFAWDTPAFSNNAFSL